MRLFDLYNIFQPALVSYAGSGTLVTSHEPRIWSLLKELNAALKDKKYLIKVNKNEEKKEAFLFSNKIKILFFAE